eukprot:gene5878-5782_t
MVDCPDYDEPFRRACVGLGINLDDVPPGSLGAIPPPPPAPAEASLASRLDTLELWKEQMQTQYECRRMIIDAWTQRCAPDAVVELEARRAPSALRT